MLWEGLWRGEEGWIPGQREKGAMAGTSGMTHDTECSNAAEEGKSRTGEGMGGYRGEGGRILREQWQAGCAGC